MNMGEGEELSCLGWMKIHFDIEMVPMFDGFSRHLACLKECWQYLGCPLHSETGVWRVLLVEFQRFGQL